MNKSRSAVPLIAAVLLLGLLPVLYVGSYVALVVPEGTVKSTPARGGGMAIYHSEDSYRVSESAPGWAERLFWPMEQIDRKVRPDAWDRTTYRTLVVG
jgi:hypothetical protein